MVVVVVVFGVETGQQQRTGVGCPTSAGARR
jgi:hypothetical protein